MKKNISKRILPLALIMLMVSGNIACGKSAPTANSDTNTISTDNDTGTVTADSDISTSPVASNDGPLVPFEKPVTITWGIATSAVQKFFDGDTFDDNVWTRKIKEELNIDVKVAFSADNSTDAYKNKMNTLLASGDLPDIVSTYDLNFFNQAQKAGYLADLTDLIDQYGTDGLKDYQNQFTASFEGAKIDDRLYAFPSMNDNFHTAVYLWIRDDWLKNTNSQPPETLDEMVELARKFTFDDPNQNGIKDTFGLSFNKNLAENLVGILGAYGVPALGGDSIFYRGKDGKMTFSFIQPEVKDALALVRDMYNEGLIDPEFIVKDQSAQETDIGAGALGMAYYRNWGTWYPWNIAYENEGAITRPYPIPTVEGVDYKLGIQNDAGGRLFLLNSKCENPEAFVKMLNLYNYLCWESKDPNDFKTFWEDQQSALSPVEVVIPNEIFAPQIFDALAKGSDSELSAAMKPFYQYVVDFESGANTDPNAYGTWGQMFDRGSMAIALNDYRKDDALVTNIMGASIPDIWLESQAVLGTIAGTAFTDIVIGNKELDYFDVFVQDWLNNGGQQTLDELEVLYPAD